MIKQRISVDMGEGYKDIVYTVQKAGSPIIGTYRICLKPDGTSYGAQRDYHRKLLADDKVSTGYIHACNFHGGALSECDGSSMVAHYATEAERWACAERMAG